MQDDAVQRSHVFDGDAGTPLHAFHEFYRAAAAA